MTKVTARIFLILLILSLATLACVGGDGGGASGGLNPGDPNSSAVNATATYGAEQFHLQLTAQARAPGP